jgi:hypothetical protein
MRKVYLQVVVRLVITVDEGVSMSDAMDTMAFETNEPQLVQIEESSIENYEITDSK